MFASSMSTMSFTENFHHLTKPSNSDRAQAFHRNMRANEMTCIRHNTIVRVDAIHAAQQVAFCSVRQHLFGVLRRRRSSGELTWQAEKALAPLTHLGLVTMITVLQQREGAATPAPGRSLKDGMRRLWEWLGSPFPPDRSNLPSHDPFGWRQAMIGTDTP